MRRPVLALPLICLALLAGCANLAPDYTRPALPVPQTIVGHPGAAPGVASLDWQQLIGDERLRRTVELALANNRDLRIAALNIETARAQYRIDDAARYPAVDASFGGSSARASGEVSRKYSAGVALTAYEVDFFGRLANLSASALQSFLASEATQRSVRTSLIAETANAWLTLASYQELEQLARDTHASRAKTYELTRQLQALGGTSKLTVAQAQATTESARNEVARYVSLVAQARSALDLLAGTPVADELLPAVGESLGESLGDSLGDGVALLVDVPARMPSAVLLQRPDIVAAEHALIAAYADIGAARAAFFPSLTLTGSSGTASASLDDLFAGGTRSWSFVPTLTLPIFNAGSLRASLSIAETARDVRVATYEKAIQTAFQEVSDALAVRRSLAERMAAQRAEVDAYATSLRLSTERYRSGADSYLSVLDSQRSLYVAQVSLIALQLSERSNRITLFKVLGGE